MRGMVYPPPSPNSDVLRLLAEIRDQVAALDSKVDALNTRLDVLNRAMRLMVESLDPAEEPRRR